MKEYGTEAFLIKYGQQDLPHSNPQQTPISSPMEAVTNYWHKLVSILSLLGSKMKLWVSSSPLVFSEFTIGLSSSYLLRYLAE